MGNPSPKRRLSTGSLFGGSWAGGTSTLWGALPEYWSRAMQEEILHGNIDKACFDRLYACRCNDSSLATLSGWLLLEAWAYTVVRVHITDRGISMLSFACMYLLLRTQALLRFYYTRGVPALFCD